MGDDDLPLVARLIQNNYDDYTATTNALLENLRAQLADRDAQLAVIRQRVNDLMAGPWMPHPDEIVRAVFYPSTLDGWDEALAAERAKQAGDGA